jgi:methylated-DNA-[protein]-cysteine S-methyltransferase
LEDIVYFNSPIGQIGIKTSRNRITSICFVDKVKASSINDNHHPKSSLFQLDSYCNGSLKKISLELEMSGTDFQRMVYDELRKIQFGHSISYIELARKIGDESAVRAVGLANGKNKIAFVIPCYRIIGNNGKIIGYSCGLWRKEWLLNQVQKLFLKGILTNS